MNRNLSKLRLSGAKRQVIRFFASIALVLGLLYLVQFGLLPIAILLALASKWQVVLGGPRLWLHNLWDNIVDVIFIFSVIALMDIFSYDGTNVTPEQLGVVGLYLAWQIYIKPRSGVSGHSVQALLMLATAVSVLFILKPAIGVAGMIVPAWIVAVAAADHFLISITDDTSLRQLLSVVWALIVTQAVWIFGHWLVFYPFFEGRVLFPQAMFVIVAMGYVFGTIYYDHHHKRLSRKRLYYYLGLMAVIVLVLIMGSEWVSRV